jgi:LuxR family quorum-sensing transcriptional regulator LasR
MVELAKLITLLDSEIEADWGELLFSLALEKGFEFVLYGVLGSKRARPETAFLHSNYAAEWHQRYVSERWHQVDPTIIHCLASSVPIVWEPAAFNGPGQRELYAEACRYGIRAGIAFPIHGPNGEFGMLSFARNAPPDQNFARSIAHVMPDLALIRDYAFASSLKFVTARTDAEPVPHLTKRELEVINWVMAGKSSWEISKITSCSEATINFHVSNIRQKFNVNTRQQALVKAIALGIITPEAPHR